MVFQVSPAVNVTEFDALTSVPAVATSLGAIAMHAAWGPADVRVTVTSENELVETFWKPNSNTASDFFSAADFLSYSNALEVVRVIDTTTSGSTARNSHSAAANTSDTVIKNKDDYDENYSTGISGVGSWVAKYPGVLGNSLKVSVCPSVNAWSSTLTGNVALTSNTTSVTGNNTLFDTEVTVGDYLVLGPDNELRKVASIASNTSLTLSERYQGNTILINSVKSSSVERRWEFHKDFDAAPGTSSYANTVSGTSDELHIAVVDEDGEITGSANQVLERFQKVSFASDAKTVTGTANYYKTVINNRSKWIWWAAHAGGSASAGNLALNTTFAGSGTPTTTSLVNGRDGGTPPNADYITALRKFNDEDADISILIGGAANQTIATEIISIADTRKDLVATLSPLRSNVVDNDSYVGKQSDDTATYFNGLAHSEYVIAGSNWFYIYDKYNDVNRYIPDSGGMAGLMARTDLVRDPWWSPAGPERGIFKNVIRLAYNPRRADQDKLYKASINPVINARGFGPMLNGDKTFTLEPTPFQSINVRRLFIVLEKSIATAAKFALFEFNDEFTRARFRNLIEPFLRTVQGRRGITGFRLIANEDNNTADIIEQQQFVGDIYIKPNRSINYVQLNFRSVPAGVEFNEIIGQ